MATSEIAVHTSPIGFEMESNISAIAFLMVGADLFLIGDAHICDDIASMTTIKNFN